VILHLTSMIIGEPHAVMKNACISVKGGTPRYYKRRETPRRALDQIGQRASIEVRVGTIKHYMLRYEAEAGYDVCTEQFDAAPYNQLAA
jgi:hypothetical protein